MTSTLRWLTVLVIAVPSIAIAHGHRDDRDRRAGYIDRFEIVSTYDAYGGASFGNVGPYQVIVAVAHGKLDPRNRANAGIVDLDLAPRDEDGLVSYSADVVILRPKSARNAKRVLFYDVVNRGNKVAVTGQTRQEFILDGLDVSNGRAGLRQRSGGADAPEIGA